MCKIKKTAIDQADRFLLKNKLWGSDAYDAEVYARIAYDEEGFIVKFTIKEADPLCEKKQHFEWVHEDSCVEFFVNFTPEQSDKYINFEVNAFGAMNVAFRSDRYDGIPLKIEEVEALGIRADIQAEQWTVTYKIGYSFIKSYYEEFDIDNCEYVLGNIYKCGEKTEVEHYLSYFKVETEKPDFHRPEYFGKIRLQK